MVKGKSGETFRGKKPKRVKHEWKELLSVNMWESVYVRIFIFPFTITSNTILPTILTMSGEERVDLKLFIKAVNEKFQALNLRFDSLQSPFQSRSHRWSTSEEEEEEYSDARSHGRRQRSKR